MTAKRADFDYLPTTFTIFGITGDLSTRKLIPSIYHLYDHGLLPDEVHFFGVAHQEMSPDAFNQMLRDSVTTYSDRCEPELLERFVRMFTYISGDFKSDELFERVRTAISGRDTTCAQPHQLIFYLAVAPHFFTPIVRSLHQQELSGPCDQYGVKSKFVIEKPFGTDLASARELNQAVMEYMDEEQIYRMDHYLGKETVQNILLFRFTNPVINDSWKPEAIDKIVIQAFEDIGVEQRAGYYDTAGAMRDMIQSHCLALLTLVTMEEPLSLESKEIHTRKEEILRTLQLWDPDPAVSALRAQYDGYTGHEGVLPTSRTETYAALCLRSDHELWKDVPMFIETGKHLQEKATTISIHFSPCASNICKTQGIHTEPNVLEIRIQPREGISLKLFAKRPGFEVETEEATMDFFYEGQIAEEQPSPYERLIHDIIIGDQSLFPSTEEVMEQWTTIQPVLDAWAADTASPLPTYAQGSEGPEEREPFLNR